MSDTIYIIQACGGDFDCYYQHNVCAYYDNETAEIQCIELQAKNKREVELSKVIRQEEYKWYQEHPSYHISEYNQFMFDLFEKHGIVSESHKYPYWNPQEHYYQIETLEIE